MVYIHLTLLPYIPTAGELKTKPTQHSVQGAALDRHPAAYSALPLRPRNPAEERRKLGLFCNVRESAVVEARDVPGSIYDVPAAYHAAGLDREVLAAFGIEPAPKPNYAALGGVSKSYHNPEGEVTIAIVGKYTGLKDAYKSLIEALTHGGMANRVRVNLEWIESEIFESGDPAPHLENVTAFWCRADSARAARRGKSSRRKFARQSARRPISASVSACRWR